jgi:hypothetical protein
VSSAPERPRTGLGDEPFTSSSYTGLKSAHNPFNRQGMGSGCGSLPPKPKDWLRSSETSTNVSKSWCAM